MNVSQFSQHPKQALSLPLRVTEPRTASMLRLLVFTRKAASSFLLLVRLGVGVIWLSVWASSTAAQAESPSSVTEILTRVNPRRQCTQDEFFANAWNEIIFHDLSSGLLLHRSHQATPADCKNTGSSSLESQGVPEKHYDIVRANDDFSADLEVS